MKISEALFVLAVGAGVLGWAQGRRGGNRPSSRFFGDADWFETTEAEGCSNPPDDGGGGGDGDGGGGGGDEAFGDGDEEAGRFVSLANVDVCDNESEGEPKCICVRSRFRLLRFLGYRLKCGVCSMTFVPQSSGFRRSGVKEEPTFGALISLEGAPRESGAVAHGVASAAAVLVAAVVNAVGV